MTQPRRCPTCLNIMPLTRRKCPYCNREFADKDPVSLDLINLHEQLTGKFEIISELHKTKLTSLYLVQDLKLDRKVALKTLRFYKEISEHEIERWKLNLKRCLRINEPHVARIYSFGKAGGLLYIILELITDDTLEDVLNEAEEVIPIWKCLRIGRDIARGLHIAHNIGICHHRLTPSNIAVSRDGYSRLLDLGSAHGTIDSLFQKPWSTQTDSSRYFAPEQIESGISEPLSDQYRLGAILYRTLAHQPPFEETGEFGAFIRLEKDPEAIQKLNRRIPDELDKIIGKAMARNPLDRFDDCNEFALALESLDPDLWLPEIESAFKSHTPQATVALLLDEARRNEKNREYYRAVSLCEQALVLAPYNTEVTSTMLRVQQLHEKALELDSIKNKALITFYSGDLDEALRILATGKKIDRDNAEILKLTHEILQEQERHRLVKALLDAARIDISKQALSSAMSSVVRVLDIDSANEDALKLKQQIEFGMEDRATLGLMVSRAESSFSSNRIEEAEDLIGKIFKIDPSNFHAKKLGDKIRKLKKHRRLLELWEQFDLEIKNEAYRPAIAILKQISILDPSLKPEIRMRLIRVREKLAEKTGEELAGETRPLRPVKTSDLKKTVKSDPPKTTILTQKPQAPPATQPPATQAPAAQAPAAQAHPTQLPVAPSANLTESNTVEKLKADIEQTEDLNMREFHPETFSDLIRNRINRKNLLKYAGIGLIVILLLLGFFSIINRITNRPQTRFTQNKPVVVATEQPVPTIPPTVAPTSTPEPTSTPTPSPEPFITQQPTVHKQSDLIESLIKSAESNETNGNNAMAAALYKQVLKKDRSNQIALKGLQRTQKPPKATGSTTATHKNNTPTPIKKAQIPTKNEIVLKAVRCLPESPEPGKDLQVFIELILPDSNNLRHLWLFYRKPGDLGFSQVYANKTAQGFTVTIPGDEIVENKIMYFLNGMDAEKQDYFFGSPDHPKSLP